MTQKEEIADVLKRAVDGGRPFVFIAEAGDDGQLYVSGTCGTEWLAKVLDVVRAGLPGVRDTAGHQTKIVEVN